jgi:crotonobetainyl-CoA:carnitine CoA-transferase CaiB-like acyl-CoA transferase
MSAAGPLAGFRVVELCHHLVGPLACRHLADFGADVVKVEPLQGDARRNLEPTLGDTLSTQFLAINRNKRSLCIDLDAPAGVAVVDRLLERADALVTNVGVDWLATRGLGLGPLAERHPRLVVASLSAYGPKRDDYPSRAFDLNVCGEAGLWLFGEDGRPRSNAAPIVDTAGATTLALGVTLALLARERSGVARRVDVDLLGVAMSLMAHRLTWMDGSPAPDLSPTLHASDAYSAAYSAYEASDAWVTVGAISEALFRRLLDAVGLPEVARAARYATWNAVLAHQDELRAQIAPRIRQKTAAEWVATFEAHGVPAGRLRSGAEVWEQPALGPMIEHVRGASVGDFRGVVAPCAFDGRRAGTRTVAPRLGEHGPAILRELGMTDAEIAKVLPPAGHATV